MIILKTFALSQIVFTSQFCNISRSDIKRIESTCYKFVWSGNIDLIKRSVLKNPKNYGGINGIDVDCFLRAIKIKQYVKSNRESEVLREINEDPERLEDIKVNARDSMYKLYRASIRDLDGTEISTSDQMRLANVNLRGFLRVGSRSDKISQGFGIETYSELSDYEGPRGKMNGLLRSIPIVYRATLLSDFEYRPACYGIMWRGKFLNMEICSSKRLQWLLKLVYKKVSDPSNWLERGSINWRQIWNIKNPSLRSIRFKLAHKAIFCNYRRFKCGLSPNDNCIICGQRETIEHQLYDCVNAKRMWDLAKQALRINYSSFEDVVCVTKPILQELVGSVIVKLLIQIDRSKNITKAGIMRKIQPFVAIEEKVQNSQLITLLKSKIEAFFNAP